MQHLVEVFILSKHFLERLLKANLIKKKQTHKCEKETFMEKPGILWAQFWCLKEEEEMYSTMAYDNLEGLS